MKKRLLALSMVTVLCGLVLAGCGRKGALEPAPASMIENANGNKVQKPREDKPFILDSLIK